MASIHSTSNYEQFSLILVNRDIIPKKVARMAEAIKRKNFLPEYPIVVNKRFEILDGQHRYLAAKTTKTPIHYLITDKMETADVGGINSLQDKWTTEDYIRHYARREGFRSYRIFMRKMEEWAVPATVLMEIFGISGSVPARDIREGTLDLEDNDKVTKGETFYNALLQISEYVGFWKNHFFVRAFRKMYFHQGYVHRRMITKIKNSSRSLVRCASSTQYLEMLQDMFNHGEPNKRKVNFLF
jgi:hypothetical protein